MPELVFEIENWEEIFQTLSLDVAAPYFGRMGLVVPEGFVEGVRRHLAAFRQRELEGSGALDAIPHIAGWMGDAFDPAFVEYLHRWGKDIFRLPDGVALHLWSSIARYRGSPRHEPLPQPPAFLLRLRETLAQMPSLDVYDLGPVSPWDRFIYAWRESTDYINPMVLVDSTIDNYEFRLAWMLTSRELPGPENMAEVKAWGWLAAQQMRLPLERLGDPGSWSPLPPPWAPV